MEKDSNDIKLELSPWLNSAICQMCLTYETE